MKITFLTCFYFIVFSSYSYSQKIETKNIKHQLKDFSIFKDVEAGIRGVSKVLMMDRYKNARDNAKTAKEQILMFGKAGYGGVTPEGYLAGMSGIIEAAQDYSGLGRIY